MDIKYKYLSEYLVKNVKELFCILNCRFLLIFKFKVLSSFRIYWYLNFIKNGGLFLFCVLEIS